MQSGISTQGGLKMVSRWLFSLILAVAAQAATAQADPLNVSARRVSVVQQQAGGTTAAGLDEEDEEDEEGVEQASGEEAMESEGDATVAENATEEGAADEHADGDGHHHSAAVPSMMDDGSCALGGCGHCARCRQRGCGGGFYGRGEYLYWWAKGEQSPALVTTSQSGVPQVNAGVLPGATVLFGNSPLNGQGRSGGRFTLGYWLDPGATIGIESVSLFLQQTHTSYNSGPSNGLPILARPFFNTSTGAPDADLIAYPGLVAGQVQSLATTKVWGTELNVRRLLVSTPFVRTDFLAGYRYLRFDESLQIDSKSTVTDTGGNIPFGTTFGIHDAFGTQNQFNGGNIGLRSEVYRGGRFSMDVLTKCAIGVMQQKVAIDGTTTTAVPGYTPTTASGGLLAQPQTGAPVPGGNIGTYTRNQFAVIPELNTNVYFQLNRRWRMNVGYSFLYAASVVRPANQIDVQVDPNRLPPPLTPTSPHPTFSFYQTGVWLQGVSLGLEAKF